jgi:hypothetical protein
VNFEKPLRFVRLNLTGEIVEVVGQSSLGLTIKYLGEQTTLSYHEITPLTPEEEAVQLQPRKRRPTKSSGDIGKFFRCY